MQHAPKVVLVLSSQSLTRLSLVQALRTDPLFPVPAAQGGRQYGGTPPQAPVNQGILAAPRNAHRKLPLARRTTFQLCSNTPGGGLPAVPGMPLAEAGEPLAVPLGVPRALRDYRPTLLHSFRHDGMHAAQGGLNRKRDRCAGTTAASTLGSVRTRPLPYTRRLTGTRSSPRILLKPGSVMRASCRAWFTRHLRVTYDQRGI